MLMVGAPLRPHGQVLLPLYSFRRMPQAGHLCRFLRCCSPSRGLSHVVAGAFSPPPRRGAVPALSAGDASPRASSLALGGASPSHVGAGDFSLLPAGEFSPPVGDASPSCVMFPGGTSPSRVTVGGTSPTTLSLRGCRIGCRSTGVCRLSLLMGRIRSNRPNPIGSSSSSDSSSSCIGGRWGAGCCCWRHCTGGAAACRAALLAFSALVFGLRP